MPKFTVSIVVGIFLFLSSAEVTAQKSSPTIHKKQTHKGKQKNDKTHEEFIEEQLSKQKMPYVKLAPFSKSRLSNSVTIQNISLSNEASPQNEPSIRISHKDPNVMLAAWRDFRTGVTPAVRRIGYTFTTDGGATWSPVDLLPLLYQELGYTRNSDPAVCVDTAGNFYASTVALSDNDNRLKLMVHKTSADAGGTFNFAYFVPSDTAPIFYDKEYIECDLNPGSPYINNIYVAWSGLNFSRSTDAGATWSSAINILDDGFAPDLAIGKDGSVYVSASTEYVYFTKSTDGGVSFNTPIAIDTMDQALTFSCGTFSGVTTIAVIAADVTNGPFHDNIYIVWSDKRNGDMDIFLKYSSDGGTSWSAIQRVNDDPIASGKDQFWPWIAVDDRGIITIVYYDTRNTPSCTVTETYMAYSVDGGRHFKNNLVSTAMSARNTPNYDVRFGDYICIDSWGGNTAVVWTDERAGGFDMDIYCAVIHIDDSVSTGSIQGTVFNDLNGNGNIDSIDLRLPNRQVFLTSLNDTLISETDSLGNYLFKGLPDNTYTVNIETPHGWITSLPRPTKTYSISLNNEATLTGKDFGIIFVGDNATALSPSEGWNLLSIPRNTTSHGLSSLLPFAEISSLPYAYNNGYTHVDSLFVGSGYWLKFNNSNINVIAGDSVSNNSITVRKGWNLIGALTKPISVSTISTLPDSLITSHYYDFSNEMYNVAGSLEPGQGYWAKAKADGKLFLSSSSTETEVTGLPKNTLVRFNSLTIEDASHHKSILYFSEGDDKNLLSQFELPPAPPEYSFDARFTSQHSLELYSGETAAHKYPIKVQSNHDPITIEWNIVDETRTFTLQNSGNSNRQKLTLRGNGSMSIASLESGKLILGVTFRPGIKGIPATYSLSDCYPNPFNPTTNFGFRIANTGIVSLKIYDMLGREASTLLDKQEYEAGEYEIPYNASSLTSGVYCYRISIVGQNGILSFTDKKKMILIK